MFELTFNCSLSRSTSAVQFWNICVDKYDKNNSGGIDQGEVENLLRDLNFPRSQCLEIFLESDENSDGELQFPEFVNYFNALNARVVTLAQLPMLSMTKDLLNQQNVELQAALEALEQEAEQLDAQIESATISTANSL